MAPGELFAEILSPYSLVAKTMQTSSEFDYLQTIAAKYGSFYVASEIEAFCTAMNEEQLGELAQAYDTIEKKEDAFRISRWMDRCLPLTTNVSYRERRFAQQVTSLFNLFRFLGSKSIAPFATKKVRYIEPGRKPNWGNLPAEIRYLKGPAEKYGVYGTENDMLEFLERASDEDMDILGRTAEQIRLNGHMKSIDEWLSRFPLTDHEEAWLVYCLLGVLDHNGLL